MEPLTPQHRPARQPTTPTTPAATPPTIGEPLDISFGVEFEFILIENFPRWQEWESSELKDKVFCGLSQVGDVLKNARFKCSSCGDDFHMPIGVQPANQSWRPDHSGWNVVADASMQLTERQKALLKENHYDMMGIEVTSRKLFADREQPVPSNDATTTTTTDHQHTISTADEIATILGALKQAFNSPEAAAQDGRRPPRWLVVNKTCDLHVHVGNDNKGFPLQTAQNLVSLCTAFERVTDGMHPYTRTGGTGLALAALDALDSEPEIRVGEDALKQYAVTQHEPYNVGFVEHSIARAWCQRRENSHHPSPASVPSMPVYPFNKTSTDPVIARAASGLHTAAFLSLIQSAPSLNSLIENLVCGKETTVSLMYLLEWESAAKTIEFRQHAAATTPAETLPWIDFATAFVRYAHASSADDIRRVCTDAANDPTLSLMELLVLLPMRQQHMHYYLDRAAGSTHFYDDVAARAEVQAAFGNVVGPLRTIALELIDEEKAGYDITAVRKGVRGKFDAGGYGQFSREVIDVYASDLDDEVKVKLTIGWETPAHESDDEEEFPPLPAIPGVEDIEAIEETAGIEETGGMELTEEPEEIGDIEAATVQHFRRPQERQRLLE
jgi:hypothetical protein